MKTFLLLLLCSVSAAFGQGFSFCDHPFMGLRSAAAPFTPTSISSLAYYWDYTDLANGAVGTWTDRIQGLSLTQATGSRKPTKSSTGVLFSIANNTSLTCSQTSVGSTNVSIWCVMNMPSVTANWGGIFGDCPNAGLFQDGGANGKMVYYPRSGTMFTAAANVWYDWITLYTNVSGSIKAITNGVSTGTSVTGFDTPFRITVMGNDAGAGGEPWGGYIKFIGVWTNKQLSITEAQNLYTWSQAH